MLSLIVTIGASKAPHIPATRCLRRMERVRSIGKRILEWFGTDLSLQNIDIIQSQFFLLLQPTPALGRLPLLLEDLPDQFGLAASRSLTGS